MTRRRIEFRAWGVWARSHELPAYAMVDDRFETPAEAVARAIARKAGLAIAAGPRSEGTALDDHGRPESRHYAMTLGRPVARRYGGGYSVEGEVWFSVPVR